MERRECLTILGAVIAGPLVARTQCPPRILEFDGATDYMVRQDISGLADSQIGSFWIGIGECFDLSTAEGRTAALSAAGWGKSRWVGE